MDAKPYTAEQARMAAENLDAWCDEETRSAQKSGERVDVEEERIEAASWREYAAMKENIEWVARYFDAFDSCPVCKAHPAREADVVVDSEWRDRGQKLHTDRCWLPPVASRFVDTRGEATNRQTPDPASDALSRGEG